MVLSKEEAYTDIECKHYNRKVNLNDYPEEKRTLKFLGLDFLDVGFVSKNGFENDFTKDKIHFKLVGLYK